MRSFLLNKLVRDKVFADMQSMGQQITYRKIVADAEFKQALKSKVLEEAHELQDAGNKTADELADLLEIIEELGKQEGLKFEKLRDIQAKRRNQRGGFSKRIFIEKLGLADNDPWVKYYSAEPKRFKEQKND